MCLGEKKKVLMICESFGGGVFAYVSQLCNDLVDEFDVYMAYSVRPQTPKNYLELIDSKVNMIEIEEFKNFSMKDIIVKGYGIINALKKLEREINPDIIHLHSSIAGGFGRIAFRDLKKNIVYTPHGYAFILLGPGLKSKAYYFFEKILAKFNNTISLTCCESEESVAKEFSDRTHYIETGISIEKFSKIIPMIEKKSTKIKIFTLGRICKQKRPSLFNEIAKNFPDISFVWIGDGELRNQLTAHNVEITGWKNRAEALKIASECDVFILCSYGEAIAMSLLENMYMKKLCIVSNTVGNKSVIHNKCNGYVCESINDYIYAIKEIVKEFPIHYVEKAYNDIINVYNTKMMKKKYIEYYTGLIKNSRYY